MPSFRVILGVGVLRAGVEPPSVLPAAAHAAAALTTVEANSVELVAGEPRIVVRFTADDAEHALRIAAGVEAATRELVEIVSRRVTKRVGGRWHRIG